MCNYHYNALDLFSADPPTRGFIQLLSSDRKARISIASTATCIRSLLSCPEFSNIKHDFTTLWAELETRTKDVQLDSSGLYPGNPFTVGLLLPVLKRINTPADSLVVKACLGFAQDAVKSGGARIGSFRENGYLTYWILRGLDEWGVDVGKTFAAALDWSTTEFYRQVCLFQSGTDEESDAYQLGYNLLIQYRYRRKQLKSTVLALGLKTLFDAQLERGVWEKKDPLFVYGTGGDAYCFSFELLTALLSNLDQDKASPLVNFEEPLGRAFQWIVRTKHDQTTVPAWRSGHRVDKEDPESWATAEVYLFLQLYRSFLSQRIQRLVMSRFKSEHYGTPDENAFDDLYLPKIQSDDPKLKLLSDYLKEGVLLPLRSEATRVSYSLVHNPQRRDKMRSGILFGPPGTGKTTIVKCVARFLGWQLVILDPSDFASAGLPLLPNTTSKIFTLLYELEDTVIFLDEMEELIRERKGADPTSFEQKFLTTSLLPKLQDLSDRAHCIFFVATNHGAVIDEAVRREGRFGFCVQVLPPCFEEKVRMLKDNWITSGKSPLTKLLTEFRRDEHRSKIEFATRREMMILVGALRQEPSRAGAILTAFQPSLLAKGDTLIAERRKYQSL